MLLYPRSDLGHVVATMVGNMAPTEIVEENQAAKAMATARENMVVVKTARDGVVVR
jgi:hypothetical protein